MQFAAFACAVACSALVHVHIAERRSQVGGNRIVFDMIPGSNLSAETGCSDWFYACFNSLQANPVTVSQIGA